jgi:ABC-2 type transport system permease protein
VLAVIDSPHWLAGYPLALAMGLTSTSIAVAMTVALFHLAGPKRTRLIAQVLAAIMGAAFAIGIQVAAIMNNGSLSRGALLHSPAVLARMPGPQSWLWLPARGVMGDGAALGILLGVAVILYVAITWPLVGRFAHYTTAAAGVSQAVVQHQPRAHFAAMRPLQAMRRKEWQLLWRDPWLVSQTLMQLLYLLPPALLLWRDFSTDGKGALVAVPVLVMAAGQLAGGVTWIAISGEDAPDLVATCPLSPRQIMLAKLQTVMRAVTMVFAPLVLLLACESPWAAMVSAGGIACAAAASVVIQLWFRTQAKRSSFRRRHTSSRIATFAEAFCCVGLAGTTILVAVKTWFAIFAFLFALLVLGVTYLLRPKRT